MNQGIEKLKQDANILAAMATEMDSYLRADVLFWPMDSATMPRLTLGGFWLRQHRLQALADLLPAQVQLQVSTASARFEAVAAEKIVRIEQKAHTEIDARLRLWRAYLNDVRQDYDAHVPSYPTAVESRAILAAISNALQMEPYVLQRTVAQRVRQMDLILQARWQEGDFVWPDGWQPAYPRAAYWWLYGRPKKPPKTDGW